MKTYNTLVKLSKSQLDEKRRQLNHLLDKKESYLLNVKQLDDELRKEFQELSANKNADVQTKSQFMIYTNGIVIRQTELMKQAESLNPEINKLTDEVFLHFSDMKKFEIFRDRKIENEDELLKKKIQLELDEVATNNFIRRNKRDYF